MKVTPGDFDAVTPAKTAAPSNQTEIATDSFTKSGVLENSLSGVPDVRPEAVARAKSLINDSSYPSDGTIKQLSNFFAQKLSSNEI